MSPNHCSHKFLDIDTVVVRRKDMGFTAQCILCDKVGPERTNPEAARRALTDMRRREEDEHFPGAS